MKKNLIKTGVVVLALLLGAPRASPPPPRRCCPRSRYLKASGAS